MPRSKKILSALLTFGTLFNLSSSMVIAQSGDKVFSDLNAESKYIDAIQYLKENQIVQGYPDGSFGPEKNINRAEFTKILVGAISKEPATGSKCFKDVADQWFAPYVCSAKKLGLVDGYADGNFKPEEPINFSEAAKIIANAFNLNKGVQDPNLWFKSYIEALQRENAIPLSVEYFDEKITRNEMSEIIWRVKADVNNKASRTYLELTGEGLTTAKSCSDIEERFRELQRPVVYYDVMPLMEREESDATMAPAPAMSESKAADSYAGSSGAAQDYSTTNVQEAGVDEADIIKNDGKFIYMIKGNNIKIVEAYPAVNLKETISFELGPKEQSFYPSEMYLNGDQLVVIGNSWISYATPLEESTTESKMIAPPYYGGNKTSVYVVDVANRAKPRVLRTVSLDGSYNTSRRVDGTLYLVANQYPYLPYYRYNQPIENFNTYLPRMTDSALATEPELVSPCDQIMIMPKPKSMNFLIAAAIPLQDNTKPVSRSVIVGNAETVYASPSNLYIAATDWSGPYFYAESSVSKVYRFALERGKISYAAEGVVPGQLLNQFSLDEHRGNLRVATTTDRFSSDSSSNNLYVLDSGLKVIGKIENLAPGERIYSVRFMGDKGYMVTFRSVDPLFVIDLKDDRNPKVLGELKIPGFSDYLHPYDENHIIGFGKDVDPGSEDASQIRWDAIKGFKMGMFDVTDPTKPKEMFTEIIGDQGTYSELLYNHKALLFSKEKNLIAFPISVTSMPKDDQTCTNYTYSTCPSSCTKVCQQQCTFEDGIRVCQQSCDGANSCQNVYTYPKTVFIGAYVYGVDLNSGFKLKAKITHLDAKNIEELLKNGWTDSYEKTIQRIIYIGESLYTVSQGVVKANSLNDFTEQKMLSLTGSIYNLTYGREPFLE
jgi:uncharacterized secreted protein with C-terminal beta-propeller domain